MTKAFMTIFLMVIFLNSKSQTTEEEYKYCIAGYKDVLNKGIDSKAGYTMSNAIEKTYYFGDTKTTVWIRRFIKNSSKRIVAYSVVYQLGDKSKDQSFYCIPHPDSDSDIIKKFKEDIGWINIIEANSIYKLRSILFTIVEEVKW